MKNRLLFVTIVLGLVAVSARADTLNVVTGDGGWYNFQTPTTAQVANAGWGPSKNVVAGTAFWNNWSIDGAPNHDCNIGYWVGGIGGCNSLNSTGGSGAFLADSPNTTASYLGDATTGFNFLTSPGTESVQLTMHVQVSRFSAYGLNEFGWVDATDPNAPILNPLFSGVTLRDATATFIPSGVYGFYLKSPTGTFLTTDGANGLDSTATSQTHFAVFQLPGNDHYMFGLEDLNNAWRADWDYNDLAIEMQVNPVPEPASLILMGTGLVGLFAAVRRRRLR